MPSQFLRGGLRTPCVVEVGAGAVEVLATEEAEDSTVGWLVGW